MSESAQRASNAKKHSAAVGRRMPQLARATPDLPAAIAPLAALQSSAGNRATTMAMLGAAMPLPAHVREEMESRFGADFDDVRIHDDSRAHASAANLHAKAYTHGHDIVFSANRFAPHAGPGKRLLAHELAHVVQQRRGGARPALDANAPHEHAADAAADAVAAGQSNVAVAGATGVGVACDEEEGWSAKLRRKYRETKEAIPTEYREKMQKAADFAADKAVDAVALPFGPVAAYAVDGLGSSLLHGAQKTVAGQEGAADDLKNFGRDKAQEGLGAAKGVATQLTEVADTAMWVGNEYKGLRDKAAEKIGGKEGSVGNTIVKHAINATVRALPDLADASDEAKKHGLVDPDTKQASITAPMSAKLNQWAKTAEEKLGATPREPEMFTPMEKAELASNITTQVALSFTGAEEVKIAMNVVGALSGLRGIVESIRNEKDWKTSPRFWGSVIGMGLSIVGLKHTMAASKFTTLLLKFGWVAAAIPPLAHMAADYFKLETHPDMPEDERKKLEASIKQDWIAAIHVIKDAILHVAQSQGGSSAKKSGGGTDEGTPAKTVGGAVDEGVGAKPAPKAGAAEDAATKAPPAAKPAAETQATPKQPVAATATPVVKPQAANTPPAAASAHPDAAAGATPISSGKGRPQSDASKALTAKLARQAPERAGSVTKLPVRKAGGTPPSEPALQKVPVVAEMAGKIAVGQTHGGDGGQGERPKLSLVPDPTRPMASAKAPGGGNEGGLASSGSKPGSTTSSGSTGGRRGSKPAPPASAPGESPGKAPAAKEPSAKPGQKPSAKPVEKSATKPAKKKGEKGGARVLEFNPIEERLQALERIRAEIPEHLQKPTDQTIDTIRAMAREDPAAARNLLDVLEAKLQANDVMLPGETLPPSERKMLSGSRESENELRVDPEEAKRSMPERADERFSWQMSEEEVSLIQTEFPNLPPKGWRSQRPVRSRPAGSTPGSGKTGVRRTRKPSTDKEEVFATENGQDFVVVDKGRTQRGDTKPEVFHPGDGKQPPVSVEVKNWPLGDEAVAADPFLMKDFLINTGGQARKRAANMPSNAEQYLIIDARGQQMSKASQEGIKRDLEVASNGAYSRDRIRFSNFTSTTE